MEHLRQLLADRDAARASRPTDAQRLVRAFELGVVGYGALRWRRHHLHCRTRFTLKVGSHYQEVQATATSSAAQSWIILSSLSRPRRFTKTAAGTLSTESRFTADRWGMASTPGSRSTSLGSPRTVVVHGATIARRSRGIAASHESTTTGRRPISGSSHHQTSSRAGSGVTTSPRRCGMTRDRPTRPGRSAGAVVRGVGGIDLDGAVASKQGHQCLIEQRCVCQLGAQITCARQQVCIDSRAHPCSCHAPIIAIGRRRKPGSTPGGQKWWPGTCSVIVLRYEDRLSSDM